LTGASYGEENRGWPNYGGMNHGKTTDSLNRLGGTGTYRWASSEEIQHQSKSYKEDNPSWLERKHVYTVEERVE
jgi:hypothetical protein